MTTMIITMNALRKRIARRLAHDGARLSHGLNPWTSGKCWLVIDASNTVTDAHNDLEEFARTLGCIHPNERLAA